MHFATGHHQKLGSQRNRRSEGHWGHRTPELFCDHAGLEITGTQPTVGLGNRGAEITEFTHRLPQRTVERLLALKHRAHRIAVAAISEKAANLILELTLFG